MQGNQLKYDNLSVNLNIISSFQFVNGKNTFFWKKKKARSRANFYFSFFIIQSYYFYHRFCFVLWLFVVVLFFLSFSWQFFLLLFSFFNFFITIFLLKTPRGLFPLWSSIMNKYCTAIASIDAQSHTWAVLMSLDLFPFQYRYLTSNSTSYHYYLSFNFITIFYFVKNSLGGFV